MVWALGNYKTCVILAPGQRYKFVVYNHLNEKIKEIGIYNNFDFKIGKKEAFKYMKKLNKERTEQ